MTFMEIFSIDFLKELYSAVYPEHHYANLHSPLYFVNLDFILIGLYVGIVIGLFITCGRRAHTGDLIGRILSAEATSPETAKSAEELGIADKSGLIRALKRRRFGSLVRSVVVPDSTDGTGDDAVDSADEAANGTGSGDKGTREDTNGANSGDGEAIGGEVRYYVDKSDAYSAEMLYGKRKGGIITAVIWAIILIPVFMLIRFFIPELLQLLDNFITGTKG